jgi:hypothetical protein
MTRPDPHVAHPGEVYAVAFVIALKALINHDLNRIFDLLTSI